MAVRPILHVVASGGFYGVERVLAALLPSLRYNGIPAELLLLNSRGGVGAEVGTACELAHVPVSYLPVRRGLDPRDLYAFFRLLRRLQPTAVHAHGYKATIFGAIGGRLARVPILSTAHSERVAAPEVATAATIESYFLKRCDMVVTVSNGVARDVRQRGVSDGRSRTIRNGIPDPGSRPIFACTIERLVVVGRLVEGKNVHVAIRALAIMAKRGRPIPLYVIGDGPERNALQAYAEAEGVTDFVHFTGFMSDVSSMLRPDTMFVMPSRSEGIPMSLLEAMAHGLAIVASRVGGIPEVVDDGVHARLLEPGNAALLADVILATASDLEATTTMRRAARLRFEKLFTVQRMTSAYAQLYQSRDGALHRTDAAEREL